MNNPSEAPDASVSKAAFSAQFAAAYDAVFAHWLPAKDLKVLLLVVLFVLRRYALY